MWFCKTIEGIFPSFISLEGNKTLFCCKVSRLTEEQKEKDLQQERSNVLMNLKNTIDEADKDGDGMFGADEYNSLIYCRCT